MSAESAAEFLDLAEEDLQRIAKGAVPHAPESLWLASVARRYNLPTEAARAILHGMRSDLRPAAGLSEDDLMRYCFRVAGAVGVLICPLLGLRDHRYLPHAAALGIGMQLTNIARDVAEDWGRSRCYLPLKWTGGLRPSHEPPDPDKVKHGVDRALRVADGFYAAGEQGIVALDRGSRLAVRAASRIYHAIGTRIRKEDCQVLNQRVRVPFAQKVRILVPLLLTAGRSGSKELRSESAKQSLARSKYLLIEHGVLP